jgi:hypothetical protein
MTSFRAEFILSVASEGGEVEGLTMTSFVILSVAFEGGEVEGLTMTKDSGRSLPPEWVGASAIEA